MYVISCIKLVHDETVKRSEIGFFVLAHDHIEWTAVFAHIGVQFHSRNCMLQESVYEAWFCDSRKILSPDLHDMHPQNFFKHIRQLQCTHVIECIS